MLDAPQGWVVRYSSEYRKQLSSKALRGRRSEIAGRLRALLDDPYNAAGSERLRHQFTGLRSAHVDKGLRFIYRICGDCRLNGDQGRRPIDCCFATDTRDQMVNMLMISAHYSGDIPEDFDFDD